jgi:peptide deformylase
MSFPWLLVKVQRHKSISVEYQDEEGNTKKWEGIDQAVSGAHLLLTIAVYFILTRG